MTTVAYTDSSINYLGRWEDFGSNIGSGWQGAQLRFTVDGTTTIDVVCDVKDTTTAELSGLTYHIDGESDFNILYFTTQPEIFTGQKTVVIPMPDTGEHTVAIKLFNFPGTQFDLTAYCRLVQFDIDTGATITPWVKTSGRLTGCVGDSWMGAQNDWPRLMDQLKYWIYPTGFGGARASHLDDQIDYDRAGVLNTDDPVLDLVIVNSSVNDYNGGVSLSSFNTSFASLVDKIRVRQPTADIFLLQSPRNVGAGKNYDQYGAGMNTIASTRSDVFYIDSPSDTWADYAWEADNSHLNVAGKLAFAANIEARLDAYYPAAGRSYGSILE